MLELVSEHRCFDGWQRYYRHQSSIIGLPMRFSVYIPPQAESGNVPVLFYLAGLTCTEETFMIKGGAQQFAARHGILLVAPDTSPRDAGVPGETDNWDFGVGAGFYVDATQEPWSRHYRMYSYIVDELYKLVLDQLPAEPSAVGVFGHSMGGHGALVLGLRNPHKFRSVSAFAPIAASSQCDWGKKALGGYLGHDTSAWQAYDATALMRTANKPFSNGILIDQGMADQFLHQLNPDLFEEACKTAGQPLTLRRHQQYDHGYYFISTFMEDHIAHHAQRLKSTSGS